MRYVNNTKYISNQFHLDVTFKYAKKNLLRFFSVHFKSQPVGQLIGNRRSAKGPPATCLWHATRCVFTLAIIPLALRAIPIRPDPIRSAKEEIICRGQSQWRWLTCLLCPPMRSLAGSLTQINEQSSNRSPIL